MKGFIISSCTYLSINIESTFFMKNDLTILPLSTIDNRMVETPFMVTVEFWHQRYPTDDEKMELTKVVFPSIRPCVQREDKTHEIGLYSYLYQHHPDIIVNLFNVYFIEVINKAAKHDLITHEGVYTTVVSDKHYRVTVNGREAWKTEQPKEALKTYAETYSLIARSLHAFKRFLTLLESKAYRLIDNEISVDDRLIPSPLTDEQYHHLSVYQPILSVLRFVFNDPEGKAWHLTQLLDRNLYDPDDKLLRTFTERVFRGFIENGEEGVLGKYRAVHADGEKVLYLNTNTVTITQPKTLPHTSEMKDFEQKVALFIRTNLVPMVLLNELYPEESLTCVELLDYENEVFKPEPYTVYRFDGTRISHRRLIEHVSADKANGDFLIVFSVDDVTNFPDNERISQYAYFICTGDSRKSFDRRLEAFQVLTKETDIRVEKLISESIDTSVPGNEGKYIVVHENTVETFLQAMVKPERLQFEMKHEEEG